MSCQHRDDGRGRCIDCGEFLDEDTPLRIIDLKVPGQPTLSFPLAIDWELFDELAADLGLSPGQLIERAVDEYLVREFEPGDRPASEVLGGPPEWTPDRDDHVEVPCVDGTDSHKWVTSDEDENICYCEICGCREY
jgi:hypothetical protein